jgi:short-subunit dehydrogenase
VSSTKQAVALVTGASRGIGAATARSLALRGYALALAARSADALTRLADELSALDCPVLVVPTDLRCPDEVRRLAELTLERFGQVDVLINNAGFLNPGVVVARLLDEDVSATLATNLSAPIELTRSILPSMLARGRGTIIFVDSVGGHISLPSAALYSTTKFGLRAFASALRREVAQAGVSVSIVSPGFIRTEMTQTVRQALLPGSHLLMGEPEQVAQAIVGAIDRPRREVVVPGYYRLFIWLEHSCPWFMDLVARIYVRQILVKQQLL